MGELWLMSNPLSHAEWKQLWVHDQQKESPLEMVEDAWNCSWTGTLVEQGLTMGELWLMGNPLSHAEWKQLCVHD